MVAQYARVLAGAMNFSTVAQDDPSANISAAVPSVFLCTVPSEDSNRTAAAAISRICLSVILKGSSGAVSPVGSRCVSQW
jgi:hypothetical protein